jgi:hypothetical protein
VLANIYVAFYLVGGDSGDINKKNVSYDSV